MSENKLVGLICLIFGGVFTGLGTKNIDIGIAVIFITMAFALLNN